MGSDDGLVPLGINPLLDQMLAQIYDIHDLIGSYQLNWIDFLWSLLWSTNLLRISWKYVPAVCSTAFYICISLYKSALYLYIFYIFVCFLNLPKSILIILCVAIISLLKYADALLHASEGLVIIGSGGGLSLIRCQTTGFEPMLNYHFIIAILLDNVQ